MTETNYKIFMHTHLGKKPGMMTINRNGNMLNGYLNILQHEEPFEGTIDQTGAAKLTGTYVTLMRTVPFVAVGKISGSAVHLQVQSERNVFELSGTACPKKKEGSQDA